MEEYIDKVMEHKHALIFVGGIAAAIAGKKILESKAVKEGCTKGMAAVLAAKKDAEECYQDMVQNAEDIVVDANKDDKKAIYVEDDEYDFLAYLGEVKNEQEFEMKSFVLALYYRSKKDFNQARHYYDVYLTSKHVNNDIGVIMDSVWSGKAKSELVAESVKKFENPVLRKLFAENHIL